MLNVHADGENRHRLETHAGTPVGWIRDRAIGFVGFRDQAEAVRAAADGARAVNAVLRREYAGWPRHEPAPGTLRVVHDGAYEWVSDGRTPVARLLHARADVRDARDAGLALEFVLPRYASEGLAIIAAQVLGTALRPHLATMRVMPATSALLHPDAALDSRPWSA